MKKILALLLALAMMFTLVACGGTTTESSKPDSSVAEESKDDASTDEGEDEGEAAPAGRFDALQTTDEQVSLYLYAHNLQPSVNEEPTEENPKVENSTRYIADEWLADKPNVVIDWCRNLEMNEEWVTVNYTAGNGPDTLFYWGGSAWVERGMALVLDEIMASPNYYEPGSPAWIDMYPAYLMDGSVPSSMALNEAGQIIALPQVLDPGSATAYYYNVDLAAELGIENPATSSWKELKENLLIAKEAGVIPTVPYNKGFGYEGGGSWDAQFSLNAAYFYPMIDDIDYNGDGKAETGESMRAQYENGFWYLQNNPAMVEYWDEYFWKAENGGWAEGFDSMDITEPWANSEVLYVEDGMWAMATYMSNTELDFAVEMFPPPYQQAEDSEYVYQVEYTEKGPYNPTISVALNFMDPDIQGRPQYTLDYVVDFFKFAYTNENLSSQVEEVGGVLGATKGCNVPASLAGWVELSFPKAPSGWSRLLPNLVPLTSTTFDALNEERVKGIKDKETWMKEYDEMLYTAMQEYPNLAENADTLALWEENFGFAADDWSDPIAPPHMQ